jgi:hypothetical protein
LAFDPRHLGWSDDVDTISLDQMSSSTGRTSNPFSPR